MVIALFNPSIFYLAQRSSEEPHKTALTFVSDRGNEKVVTVGQLFQEAKHVAATLKKLGIKKGDLVFLVLPHSQALISALWGTLYLGAVPSVLSDTAEWTNVDPTTIDNQLSQLITRFEASTTIVSPAIQEKLVTAESILPYTDLGMTADCVLPCSKADDDPPLLLPEPTFVDKDDPVYLQLTSGTTGQRKGVLISQRAMSQAFTGFIDRLQIDEHDIVVNWLPLYHDFGFFAGLLLPITLGIPLVLLSPYTVVRRPEILLKTIDRHRATLTWIFNSGYHIVAQNVREKRLVGIDLSCLRVLGCGGEPIRYESRQLFWGRFAQYGLSETVFVPGYGMAEAVFCLMCCPPHQKNPVDWVDAQLLQHEKKAVPVSTAGDHAIPLISCGIPYTGVVAHVVNEFGSPLPERHVGELWLQGDIVANVYRQQGGDYQVTNENGWFETGDLGYFAEGYFYFCGRKKGFDYCWGTQCLPRTD